jgi:Na+-transporting NADH:ubiquinone oxidoreductase subunit NqrC
MFKPENKKVIRIIFSIFALILIAVMILSGVATIFY